MKIRKWTAFIRLNGEMLVERDEEILNEFKGFVLGLKGVGIEYSLLVNVEETEPLKDLAGERPQPTTRDGMLPRDATGRIRE